MRRAMIAGLVCVLASSASADRKKPLPPSVSVHVASVSPSSTPKSSNPAFLGIQMMPHGNAGCEVTGVTRGSSAENAGLREMDVIVAMDGVATPRCDVLQHEIVSKPVGHTARLDVRRSMERIAINATLSTRAEVLHRRVVGQPLEAIDVIDADDDTRSYDLSLTRGKTTILGWFTLESCAGCSNVFDRVADGIAARLKDSEYAPVVLAVTSRPPIRNSWQSAYPQGVSVPPPSTSLRKQFGFTSTVPMALATVDTFRELAIDDPVRIHFVVVDCRGVVRFVAPIAPGSDDIDAAVDEVLAAAEQAENLRTLRR